MILYNGSVNAVCVLVRLKPWKPKSLRSPVLNMRIGESWGKTMVQIYESHIRPWGLLLSTVAFGNFATLMLGRKAGSAETTRKSSTDSLDHRVYQLFHCFIPGQAIIENSISMGGILRKYSQCLELWSGKRYSKMSKVQTAMWIIAGNGNFYEDANYFSHFNLHRNSVTVQYLSDSSDLC